MNEGSRMGAQTHPVKLLLSLALGYARWVVITPMILMWGVYVITLLAMIFAALGDQGWTVSEAIARFITGIPVIGPAFEGWLKALFESDTPFEALLIDVMLGTWAVISLVLMVLGWGFNALFGPFEAWTMRRKLAVVALACLFIPISFGLVQLAAPESMSEWFAGFVWTPIFFVVSAVCLWLSHELGVADKYFQGLDLGGQNPRRPGL